MQTDTSRATMLELPAKSAACMPASSQGTQVNFSVWVWSPAATRALSILPRRRKITTTTTRCVFS